MAGDGLGRVWCAVCPLELVANVTERLGRALGVKQRVLGKWLRSGSLIVGLYALIQMLVAGANLHRNPACTSIFLWGLLATAALTGFFFRDRAFCRGFCPVGLLLGTYGRGAMLAVRPAAGEKCAACTGRDCVRAGNRVKADARSCPSLLNPARLNSNADCLVCGQCVKVCEPDNVGIFLRRPFDAADDRAPRASWPVTLFVMLVSGFVISELLSEWKAAQAVYLWAPVEAAALVGAARHAGWIEGIWTLFVVPSIVWGTLGGLVVLARGAGEKGTVPICRNGPSGALHQWGLSPILSFGEAWRRLAFPLAAVIAFGHTCKGSAKVVSWVGFLPLSASDPVGVDTAQAITAKTHRRYRLPVLVLASGFLFIVFGWGFLQ